MGTPDLGHPADGACAPGVRRLPAHLAHAPEDDGAVAIHAVWLSPEGGRQDGGKPSRLFSADAACRGPVVVAAGRICAIDARAPLDYIEVKLENALLAEDQFGDGDQGELRSLAEDGAAGSEEEVFNQLLREGGASAHAIAVHVLLRGELDRVPIEAMVLVEARVLGGDDGVLEVGRDLAERNECVAFLIGLAVDQGLYTALDVQCGRGRVDPSGGHKGQRGKRPAKHESGEKPPDKGTEDASTARGLLGWI